MELNVINSNEVLTLANENTLLSDLKNQIEKDFGLANISLKLPVNFDAQSFVSAIREKVYYLMMQQFPEYLNLLYIVDIPENQFKQIVITDAVEIADQMTYLILKREYQKVWYRNKYK
tara:strand:- start:1741 stop:2094 length:354 start_codon:yes stop_codon:yes gene_type:complete